MNGRKELFRKVRSGGGEFGAGKGKEPGRRRMKEGEMG